MVSYIVYSVDSDAGENSLELQVEKRFSYLEDAKKYIKEQVKKYPWAKFHIEKREGDKYSDVSGKFIEKVGWI